MPLEYSLAGSASLNPDYRRLPIIIAFRRVHRSVSRRMTLVAAREMALCFTVAIAGPGVSPHGAWLRYSAASVLSARCRATRTAPSVILSRSAVSRTLLPLMEIDLTISRCCILS